MRTAITILVTFVVTSALWVLSLRYRPTWVAKIMFDKNGFPRVKKTGDKFVINGKTFYFNGSIWVELSSATGFPVNPAPAEGDTFIIDGIGYKFTNGVWVKLSGPNGDQTRKQTCVGIRYNQRTGEAIPGSGHVSVDGLESQLRCP